jgi:hypothetical protein
MGKVSYAPDNEQIAQGALPENTEQFGYSFEGHKPVEVTNPAHLRKFAGHPFFKVSGDVPAETEVVRTAAERESAMLGQESKVVVTGQPATAPTVVPVQGQPEQGPAKVTPGQADKPDGDSDLRAVHRGRGSYSVVSGEKDEEVIAGLDKHDAETFNNLSAEDKAKKIADFQKRHGSTKGVE